MTSARFWTCCDKLETLRKHTRLCSASSVCYSVGGLTDLNSG